MVLNPAFGVFAIPPYCGETNLSTSSLLVLTIDELIILSSTNTRNIELTSSETAQPSIFIFFISGLIYVVLFAGLSIHKLPLNFLLSIFIMQGDSHINSPYLDTC